MGECDGCHTDIIEVGCIYMCRPCDYCLCARCYVRLGQGVTLDPGLDPSALTNAVQAAQHALQEQLLQQPITGMPPPMPPWIPGMELQVGGALGVPLHSELGVPLHSELGVPLHSDLGVPLQSEPQIPAIRGIPGLPGLLGAGLRAIPALPGLNGNPKLPDMQSNHALAQTLQPTMQSALSNTTVVTGSGYGGGMDAKTLQKIDPDVAELCENFKVPDEVMIKLNHELQKRGDSMGGDLEKLWEELENDGKGRRNPGGFLITKVRQMEAGTWVGKVKTPPEIQRLVEKYDLDEKAYTTLTDVILKRPKTAEKDLWEIERRLEGSSNPSAITMMLIVKICKGQDLPEIRPNNPPRDRDERASDRDERSRGDRDRERDRYGGDRGDRRRSRSRSRY